MLRTILPRVGALLVVVLGILPGAPVLAAGTGSQGPDLGGLVVQPLDDGVTLHLATPDYRLQDVERDGQMYQEIALDAEDWWPVGEPGSPQLPERSVMLAVPPSGRQNPPGPRRLVSTSA